MSIQIFTKEQQAYGAFNNGEIVENKPIGFPHEGGSVKPYSTLFYWANAIAKVDSTIGLHPHQGFEIMSFVLDGSIRHYDTQLKGWKELKTGDAQIIRSGNGISHAEHMNAGSRMFQIWVDPNLNKTLQQTASYDDYPASEIPTSTEGDMHIQHYAGSKGIMKLDTNDITIERWKLNGSHRLADSDQIHSIYILEGNIKFNNLDTTKDDFIIINGEEAAIEGKGQMFVISSAKKLDYPTYAQMKR